MDLEGAGDDEVVLMQALDRFDISAAEHRGAPPDRAHAGEWRRGEIESANPRDRVALDAGGERLAPRILVVMVRVIRVHERVRAVIVGHHNRAREAGTKGNR